MEPTQITPEPRKQQEIPAEQGLSLADYLDIAKRRRWLLILPALAIFAVVAVVAALLPNQYESQATILVEQPNVGADLVQTTVRPAIVEQLQIIARRVLNRSRLEELILEHDLPGAADRPVGLPTPCSPAARSGSAQYSCQAR